MNSNVVDLTSQRLKKFKVFLEHIKMHPVHYENVLELEKKAVYKPVSPELANVIIQGVNDNFFHKHNEDYFEALKENLAKYLDIPAFNSANLFVSLNLYNFYEYLTELFLQKDQKVLLFTSNEFDYAQEAKYLNSGRIIVDDFYSPVSTILEINQELMKDDYKVVIVCSNDFDDTDMKDFVDLLPENVVLILRSNRPEAYKYIEYSTKTVMVLREFPTIMTIVEPPVCFAVSRKEVVDLLNLLQLPNHINSISLLAANYLTQYDNPVKNIDTKHPKRTTEGYKDILMNLIRENIDAIPPKDDDYSVYNIAKRLRLTLEEVVDFAKTSHFLGLSEDLKKHLIHFVNASEAHNYYSQRTLLRNMLAHSISDVNNKFHYNNIILGAGVSGLLESITRAFVADGEGYKKLYKDKALLLELSPDGYSRVVYKRDAQVECMPLKADLDVDMDLFIEKIANTKPKLVILDNPRLLTGAYFDREQLEKLISHLNEYTLLVIDESQIAFAASENDDYLSAIEFLKDHQNIIVLRSFSYQDAMAGFRLAYAVGNEHVINCIDAVRNPFDVSPYAINLGIKVMEDNEIFERVTLKFIQEQKELLYQYFSEMGFFYTKTATNFVVFSTPFDAKELQERLLPYKIALKSLKNNFVRVSINDQNSNLHLIKSLKMALAGKLHH